MKNAICGIVVCCAFLLAAPVWADGVYVPVASGTPIDGETIRTNIFVTNEGAEVRRFRTRFVPTNTDGTPPENEEEVGTLMSINPGATVRLQSIVPDGATGMLELDSAPQLSFSAQLERVTPDGFSVATGTMPIVGRDQVANAGETRRVLGLKRSQAGARSDVGVISFGTEPAQCDLTLYRSDSTRIQQTAVIVVPPLGHRHFDGALGILGEESVGDVRMDVKCSQPFFAYGVTRDAEPTGIAFHAATVSGADRVGPGAPGSVGILRREGEFFVSTSSNPVLSIPLDNLEAGVQYSLVTFEFDMRIERYRGPLFNTVFNFVRNGGPLYAALFVRGDRDKTILDLGNEREVQGPTNWSERANFRVEFTYDTAQRVATLLVFRGGSLIQQVSGGITNPVVVHNGEGINLIFGLSRVFDNAFYPPIGWRFSNLEVQGFPVQ
ncbi:MAG: hypothetical protein AAF604_19850 [Acidobacteriota bacterium]